MGKQIYADNAATTRLSRAAYEAMQPFLLEEYGNASQAYSFARNPKRALNEARASIAANIGADLDEIFFTSGGSESDNWAVFGAAAQGKRIITSSIEHHAILNPCAYYAKQGVEVEIIPVDSKGVVDSRSLVKAATSGNALISIMTANNEIGTIEPIKELCGIAHQSGCVFHTDAVQAVGHIPINVKEMGVDMLSASAHKFNGPKGIGFLYIRKGLTWPSLIFGGGQEFGHRAGTENVAAIVGMATALTENVDNLSRNIRHIYELEDIVISMLNESGFPYLRNGSNHHIPGSLSLSFRGKSGEALLHLLDFKGICVSTGSACNSKNTQISHVLQAIGLAEEYANGTIRISLGSHNTKEDAVYIGQTLIEVLRK